MEGMLRFPDWRCSTAKSESTSEQKQIESIFYKTTTTTTTTAATTTTVTKKRSKAANFWLTMTLKVWLMRQQRYLIFKLPLDRRYQGTP